MPRDIWYHHLIQNRGKYSYDPSKRYTFYFYELPHELRGVRVCLRPYAVGDGIAMQEAIEESRDHLRPWMAWTDSRRTVQECGDCSITRSANIPRRLGFVHEATLRNYSRIMMGELADTLVFAVTRDDYCRLQGSQT